MSNTMPKNLAPYLVVREDWEDVNHCVCSRMTVHFGRFQSCCRHLERYWLGITDIDVSTSTRQTASKYCQYQKTMKRECDVHTDLDCLSVLQASIEHRQVPSDV